MISFSSLTKTGGRDVNEDCILAYEESGRFLFALADGLGGHGRGDAASKLVTERCLEVFKDGGGIEDCFLDAQNSLLEEQRRLKAPEELKTTLTLLIIADDKACWGHAGDSRIYRFEDGKLTDQTTDHSVPQMLALAGEIRQKDIRHHEDRNRLLRALGIEWDGKICDVSESTGIQAGDSFLLCSDGFWEWIVEKRMSHLLKSSGSPEQWLSLMETEVLHNSAGKEMDNYSAITVFVR